MSELSLLDCENEVERARAKLAHDLQVLRSPSTMSAFTGDLKREALDTKEAMVDKLKSSAGSLAEDLKAKAAANPAATLMIGAGLAWRLLRNPPIASMLVGAGVFSLWRTQATATTPRSTQDYVREGQQRLVQQASAAAEVAGRKFAEAGEVVSQKASDLMAAAADRLEDARDSAAETLRRARAATQDTAAEAVEAATRRLHDAVDQAAQLSAEARDAAEHMADGASRRVRGAGDQAARFGAEARDAAADALGPQPRGGGLATSDVVWRGVANVALAAAVGLMVRNRVGGGAQR